MIGECAVEVDQVNRPWHSSFIDHSMEHDAQFKFL
jgi:hypothetical protein